MARPPGNESVLARNWFAWWLVEQQFQIGGEERMAELSRAVGKTELSNIRRHQRGVGGVCLDKLAPALGMTPGKFTDDALQWWRRAGKQIYAEELKKRAREATLEARESSDSGTMAAVAGPSSVPPGARKAN